VVSLAHGRLDQLVRLASYPGTASLADPGQQPLLVPPSNREPSPSDLSGNCHR